MTGSEPVREWLKKLDEPDRQGPATRPMAVAGRNALVSANGRRIMGSQDYVDWESSLASADLRLRESPCGIARFHKENAHNTRR